MFSRRRRSGVFIVKTYLTPCSVISIVNFEQVNAGQVNLENMQTGTKKKWKHVNGLGKRCKN